jgi:hypothetical protein
MREGVKPFFSAKNYKTLGMLENNKTTASNLTLEQNDPLFSLFDNQSARHSIRRRRGEYIL